MDMQIITNGQQTCLFGLPEAFGMQPTEITTQPGKFERSSVGGRYIHHALQTSYRSCMQSTVSPSSMLYLSHTVDVDPESHSS